MLVAGIACRKAVDHALAIKDNLHHVNGFIITAGLVPVVLVVAAVLRVPAETAFPMAVASPVFRQRKNLSRT